MQHEQPDLASSIQFVGSESQNAGVIKNKRFNINKVLEEQKKCVLDKNYAQFSQIVKLGPKPAVKTSSAQKAMKSF